MKPSSYPVLDNRPIDQWRVIELREELKRRRLPVKGLKEDLVRRLDEALRAEMEAANARQEEAENRVDDPPPKFQNEAGQTASSAKISFSEASEPEKVIEAAEDREAHVGIEGIVGGDIDDKSSIQVDADDCVKDAANSIGEKLQEPIHACPVLAEDESVTDKPSGEINNASSEDVSSVLASGLQSEGEPTGKVNLGTNIQPDSEDIKQLHEDAKLQYEDVKLNLSDMNNQVSEVSPSLGLPVKNVSISTDSMPVNEKMNALKDSIIANDVKLEPDVKTEMVQPSSSHVVSDGGKSHPMDVEVPHENKVSVDETDNNVTNVDFSKKNSSVDLGSPEKLNLDRSSGDDSMEEDTLESKQVDSTYNSDEVGERCEKSVVPTREEDNLVDVVGDGVSTDIKDNHVEANAAVAAPGEKRKLPDKEVTDNDEPSKRQHRWKTESVMAAEPQNQTPPLSTAPHEAPQATGFKHSLSRNNSNATDGTPKERVVPPATKPPTDSLRIDNFLRPFTLKAVQELLGKTGTVTKFWMDHIKTHCYVIYSSVEEAIKTRNAVYNLQWPPNGGKLLAAEFVDAQEVKSRLEGPPLTQTSVNPVGARPPAVQPQSLPHQQLGIRQKQLLLQQPVLPHPPPISSAQSLARERVHLPPPPPLPEKVDPPIVTLDDLFRKTKATPRIYYLPLSEEQVRAKLEARQRNSRQ